ncbi:DNA-directed RNA polymerase subunit beta [Sporolactobacillus shoreicorticis]|uniref:DNA-directed RNA polymerase subunit beta n=1 Tax=Sporolactobacillus shoreicorticis TaxID=1923877 RepID=A0ABW5S3A2_9BACL|nr:DNA-directed RNA polymerase subunit beta [Sporolactobacillus shoreicorticis]MCO7127121.1 DNA-directed RNA polymerase subunit beta [Sporolactobacillus shoreicorticis]
MGTNEKLHNKPKVSPETRKVARAARQVAQKAERLAPKKTDEEQKPLFNPFFGYKKRRFPIWQRLIVLTALCAIAFVAGTMLGYGGLGHRSPWAIFEPATWQHIFDFLKTD